MVLSDKTSSIHENEKNEIEMTTSILHYLLPPNPFWVTRTSRRRTQSIKEIHNFFNVSTM